MTPSTLAASLRARAKQQPLTYRDATRLMLPPEPVDLDALLPLALLQALAGPRSIR